jgi:hypothetical protein
MTWLIWLSIYLAIGGVVGVKSAQGWLTEELKNSSKHSTNPKTGERRPEEERIYHVALDLIWPMLFLMMIWPIGLVIDSTMWLISHKAIKAAKQQAIDNETQRILNELSHEENEKFKDL